MQVAGSFLSRTVAEFVAQFFGVLGAGKQSFDEGAKVESGSSGDDRQGPARLVLAWIRVAQNCLARSFLAPGNLAENAARLAGIFSGTDVFEGIDAIDQVMRDFRALGRGGLGGADFKFAVHGNRIAVEDFSAEVARQRQRQ